MLLNDRESYMVSDATSLKSLLARVNRVLSRLKKEKVITVKEWYMAKPTETPMARFYGLPKVHKPDVPLRPIVSLRGTPTYGLANWLFQKLRFLTAGSETIVNSAEQFLDKIRAVTIEPNERMVSFDVVSLFTSIPQALAVETLSDLLRQNYDEGDGQPTAQDLIELMGHCLKTFFTFEGITYEQIKGTPMGPPISGLIAEAVLQKLEKRLFAEYKPKFWARYVDDTFVIIDQDKISYYEELLNSIIPDLQFTMEEEVESKLSFLDVLIYRQPDGKLATSVYRKPTNTLQRLSYNSNHPLQHRRSCVRTLYRRVETHCSTPVAKLDEMKLLQELFRDNGYPRTFVERSRKQPRKRNEEPIRPKSWRSIPYMKGVSKAVARSLAPLGIGVAQRPDSKIRRQVMRPKNPIPKQEMSAVVYEFSAAAECLKLFLKFLTSDSNATVSSSTQFVEKLKGVSLLPSDIMVSFDVTSHFTPIPQDLAVETIELLLREKYDETENRLGHAQIIQLLKFCLKTYFTFDGTIYEQVKGTPMGSPISGLIAEAVLQRLESLVFRHRRPKC
nr:unnamed protein product [Spirometra erinaceieuropaei]